MLAAHVGAVILLLIARLFNRGRS
ncbi:hypothetical protein PQR75_42285 [Paraburkholderia fungorum]